MVPRRPKVGVMGSGSDPSEERSRDVGRLVARLGAHLLTGGGGGVMAAVSRAFCEALPAAERGLCLGLLPLVTPDVFEPQEGYPNPWVEVAIQIPLASFRKREPEAVNRNHANVLSSDVIVALPGAEGTRNEIELARRFGKPLALYVPPDVFADLPRELPRPATLEELERWLRERTSPL